MHYKDFPHFRVWPQDSSQSLLFVILIPCSVRPVRLLIFGFPVKGVHFGPYSCNLVGMCKIILFKMGVRLVSMCPVFFLPHVSSCPYLVFPVLVQFPFCNHWFQVCLINYLVFSLFLSPVFPCLHVRCYMSSRCRPMFERIKDCFVQVYSRLLAPSSPVHCDNGWLFCRFIFSCIDSLQPAYLCYPRSDCATSH